MQTRFTLILVIISIGAAAQAQAPPGDMNRDYRVDANDLRLFAEQWLATEDSTADFNNDGHVDGVDLAILAANWGRVECPVIINELRAHSHGIAPDWIELHNPSSIPVHIGGWTLSDREHDLYMYEIAPGTIIEPDGYLVFYQDLSFGNPLDPGTRRPFALSANGEAAYLYSGNDPTFPDYLAFEVFGASATWVTLGRYVRSTGEYCFVRMSEPTPGWANAYPLVGPVVINEIMYHPNIDRNAEYVELLNVSDDEVTLFDFKTSEPWRFTDDNEVDMRLPIDVPVTLQAGEHVLLAKNALLIRSLYRIPTGTRIVSWTSGNLSNDSGTIRLLQPGDLDEDGTPYWIEIDSVTYSNGTHNENFLRGIDPWPRAADGFGWSLSRLAAVRFGDDPNNWEAAVPTPGLPNN